MRMISINISYLLHFCHLEKNSPMPAKSHRKAANGEHYTLLKFLQPVANQFPVHVEIPLLHREGTPFKVCRSE